MVDEIVATDTGVMMLFSTFTFVVMYVCMRLI